MECVFLRMWGVWRHRELNTVCFLSVKMLVAACLQLAIRLYLVDTRECQETCNLEMCRMCEIRTRVDNSRVGLGVNV